jgi:hypothetical protein
METRSEAITVHPLKPWNPIDQFWVLWWIFVRPARYLAYRGEASAKAPKQMCIALVSTLVWLPLFIAAIGTGFGPARGSESLLEIIPPQVSAGIILIAWFLTNRNGTRKGLLALSVASGGAIILAGLVVIGMGFAEAFNWVGYAALLVSIDAGFGLAKVLLTRNEVAYEIAEAVGFGLWLALLNSVMSIATGGLAMLLVQAIVTIPLSTTVVFGVAIILDRSFKGGKATLASRLIPVMLGLAYAVLIWNFLLGG